MNIPIAKIQNNSVNTASVIMEKDLENENIITIKYEPKQLINQIAFLEVIQNTTSQENIAVNRYRQDHNARLCYRLKIYYGIYILLFILLILLFTNKDKQ